MADCFQKRGCTNCENCQLCKQKPETAAHILGLALVEVSSLANHNFVNEWWMSFINPDDMRRKSFASLVILDVGDMERAQC
jgi:hypothetical protein